MAVHDDRTFIRHFSWVLGGLVGVTIFFIFLAFLIVGVTGVENHHGYTYSPAKQKKQEQALASTAAPAPGTKVAANGVAVGNGSAGSAAAAAARSSTKQAVASVAPDGEAIWKAHCALCHQTGLAGAPKIGDKKEWAPILASANMQTIFNRDIHGYTGKRGTMPPKGGTNLPDKDVIAAAKYMIGKSGGHPGS